MTILLSSFSLILFALSPCCLVAADRVADGRYSFSLTTFDPSGRLGQVDRAMEAAEKGTPIVAVMVTGRGRGRNGEDFLPNSSEEEDDDDEEQTQIIMVAPQVLPSTFMTDDGTSRFCQVTPEIIMAHSGLSADGRVLLAAAQRMAIEHEYTFDESIPIEVFLQQLSLLFQEYTMKPAARPFGVTLVVGYVPKRRGSRRRNAISTTRTTGKNGNENCQLPGETDGEQSLFGRRNKPLLVRIDPSGSIMDLGSSAVIHLQSSNAYSTLLPPPSLWHGRQGEKSDRKSLKPIKKCEEDLVEAFQQRLVEMARRKGQISTDDDDSPNSLVPTFLTASLTSDGAFQLRRFDE